MFPLGHALFGYLLYVAFAWTARYRLPYGLTLGALLLGTQFPDIVDKPLAFFGVLPSGRSLGHSLLFVAVLFAAVWVVARRDDRPDLAVAFGFGHLSHLVADAVRISFSGLRVGHDVNFLLWPLLPASLYPGDSVAPWARLVDYYQSPELTPGLALLPVAFAVFVLVEVRRRRHSRTDLT